MRKKNPPVTASPCQPPLGKGAEGTGERIATASVRTGFAMTWFFMGAGQGRAAGWGHPALRRETGSWGNGSLGTPTPTHHMKPQ